jgi:hypothetical protein
VASIAKYETSSLDWGALRSLARRAAQGTTLKPASQLGYVRRHASEYQEVLGPHWVLDHRRYHQEVSDTNVAEEEHWDEVYALLPDGDLVYVRVVEGVIRPHPVSGRPSYPSYIDDHTRRSMSDLDAEVFDFVKHRYERHNGARSEWGDSYWSHDRGALLHDSKGAGLLSRLDDVLNGRETNLPGLIPSLHIKTTPPPKSGPTAKTHPNRRSASFDPISVIGVLIGVFLPAGIFAVLVWALTESFWVPFIFSYLILSAIGCLTYAKR